MTLRKQIKSFWLSGILTTATIVSGSFQSGLFSLDLKFQCLGNKTPGPPGGGKGMDMGIEGQYILVDQPIPAFHKTNTAPQGKNQVRRLALLEQQFAAEVCLRDVNSDGVGMNAFVPSNLRQQSLPMSSSRIRCGPVTHASQAAASRSQGP